MHKRYTDKEMEQIWSEQNKFSTWYDVEQYVCEILGDLGTIPNDIGKIMSLNKDKCLSGNYVEQIEEIEATTKHDIIAFLTHLSNTIGDSAKHIHYGMTSQDLIDTAQAVIIKNSINLIVTRLNLLLESLKDQAIKHKHTFCIGRSHGIHAEPMTFGLKLLTHYAAFKRCVDALERDLDNIVRIKCSGTIGTYTMNSPEVEESLALKLGIRAEDISTQVVPRERLALLFSHLSIIASCIERLATEIRHLQRTEVGEVIESFSKGQKGSSAMPHKKNPILTENLTGLARTIRMAIVPAMENITLWHERDISHSSAERILLPDTFVHLSFALKRINFVVQDMKVDVDRMRNNLWKTDGVFFSQLILLKLIKDKGFTRENAYAIIQHLSHKKDGEFRKNVIQSGLFNKEELNECFDVTHYTKHIEYVYNKVLKDING